MLAASVFIFLVFNSPVFKFDFKSNADLLYQWVTVFEFRWWPGRKKIPAQSNWVCLRIWLVKGVILRKYWQTQLLTLNKKIKIIFMKSLHLKTLVVCKGENRHEFLSFLPFLLGMLFFAVGGCTSSTNSKNQHLTWKDYGGGPDQSKYM